MVREITETSVKLSDPKLGNIEMTRERFSEIFTGYALVISNPNNLTQVNGTNQSTEDTDTGELEKLASEDIQDIRGRAVESKIAAIAVGGAVWEVTWYIRDNWHTWTFGGVRSAAIRGAYRALVAAGVGKAAKILWKLWPKIRHAIGIRFGIWI